MIWLLGYRIKNPMHTGRREVICWNYELICDGWWATLFWLATKKKLYF